MMDLDSNELYFCFCLMYDIYVICDKFAYCFRGFVFGCKDLIHSIKYWCKIKEETI